MLSDADAVVVTTYSSLFNTNPFFSNANIIIIDDAHAAENYISDLWSLQLSRNDHPSLHASLCILLKQYLNSTNFRRISEGSINLSDKEWIDKIPTPDFIKLIPTLTDLFDTHASEFNNLKFNWSLLKSNLASCHMYLSVNEILIRPLIPPTWTHNAFTKPRQRIFMSATLGIGGDLERITGRENINRLPIPEGWDSQGMGRRFFIFPERSLDEENITNFKHKLMKKAGRSLVLVPNLEMQNKIIKEIKQNLKFDTFTAENIEESKSKFIENEKAVALVAGRYDGIDFPGNECRLLFIEALPKAMNIQERFLMSKMGAAILYNERILTRVIQAIGRCTRSTKDYSAVVVSGEELTRYLTDIKKIPFFSSELQAELNFGIEQSKDADEENLLENFDIFINQEKEWKEINEEITVDRDKRAKEELPATKDLEKAVAHEIEYQKQMWKQDYNSALNYAEKVLGAIGNNELKGYRALWHYLAGSTAYLAKLDKKMAQHFKSANNATNNIPWLVDLHHSKESIKNIEHDHIVYEQIENIERILNSFGTINDRKFSKREKEILDGIIYNKNFENAQRLLGELVGFIAGKIENNGSPDPWWISGKQCLVFEDHVNASKESSLNVNKARQVCTHPNWMKDNIPECNDKDILAVLVSPISKVDKGASSHLSEVSFWHFDEYQKWAKNAVAIIRELRNSFTEPGDFNWRKNAYEKLTNEKIDMKGLFEMLKSKKAQSILTIK
ncbi:MAG: hypothetical protein K2X69_07610 [Silvanigrellaceae bacterium]|nr:hypothetical protein [Silvanigrellaceae bacterium]